MDWTKAALLCGILTLSLALLFKWNEFQDNQEALAAESAIENTTPQSATALANNTPTAPVNNDASSASSLPRVPVKPTNEGNLPQAIPQVNATTPEQNTIRVQTDKLDLLINLRGGDIVKSVLTQHKVKLNGEQGFTLLDITPNTTYVSQSGLIGTNGTDNASGRPLFNSQEAEYVLKEGENQLNVDLTLEQDGVSITKRFTFTRDEYLVNVTYLIDNQSANPWAANFYGQIKRDSHQPPAAADSGFGVNPYVGAATTREDEKYQKISFDDMDDEKTEFSIQGGWVAMIQHYFTSAWVGNKDDSNFYFLKKLNQEQTYLMGYVAPETVINAGQQGEITARFYVGPKDIDRLEAIAENLDLTIDFGWLWWIAKPLFHLLDFLHTYIGNWGWSIIALTIIIKAIFFYPSAMSYRSMARMRQVAPKMQAIKESCGDDRQKLSQEMMKLYKKEKVNPMGGCLPILIQMPVFIALYWVLMESVEIRHAPFALWIQDLSVMDPYFIFPLLMGATMFIQQKLNPTPPDPMQAKIMQWMPVAFTFMFLWFPAGLVIYWVTNNTLSIIQQWVITRNIEKTAAAKS